MGALAIARPASALGTVSDYLLIGTGDADVAGTTIAISNFEIGRNVAAVPMPGLTLVEAIPAGTLLVPTGVLADGEMAITEPGGRFDFADLLISGVLGLRCAAPGGACNDGVSDTTFNGLPFPADGFTGGVDFSALRADLAALRNEIRTLPRDELLVFPDGIWGTWPASTSPRGSRSSTSTPATTTCCSRTATS